MLPLKPAPKILLVDDEAKMCATLQKVLASAGYAVEVAYNTREASERIEWFRPDCVILDLRMPGGSGYDWLRRLKSAPRAPQVIITTAVTSETIMQLCMKAGAAHYMLKPINFQKLLTRIKTLLDLNPQPGV